MKQHTGVVFLDFNCELQSFQIKQVCRDERLVLTA